LQPKLNRKSEQIAAQTRPNMPIEDLLAGKGKLLQQKQAERERRLEQRAQEMRQVLSQFLSTLSVRRVLLLLWFSFFA
jgi:hypothetical protein